MKRRTITVLLVVLALLAGLWFAPPVRRFRRSYRAQQLYVHAIALYMVVKVDEAKDTLEKIADRYAELPIGAMARIKLAFLAYDDDDNETESQRQARLDRAERLFTQYLDDHPQSVLYLSNSPMPDYEGELELVAWYFLGRIARDRGNIDQALAWFHKVADTGSENPSNMIVGKTNVLLREMEADQDA